MSAGMDFEDEEDADEVSGGDVAGESSAGPLDDADLDDDDRAMLRAFSNNDTIRTHLKRNTAEEVRRNMTWGDRLKAGATGLGHGLSSNGPEQMWRMARTAGKILKSKALQDQASEQLGLLQEQRDLDPLLDRPDMKNDAIAETLYDGMNSVGTSAYTIAAGTAAGAVTGGAAGLAVLGGGAGVAAGLAEFDSFMEQAKREFKAINPALTDEEIESDVFWQAVASGLSEGVTEGVGDVVGARFVGLFGKAGAPQAKNVVYRLFQNMVRSSVTEGGTEVTNAIIQDRIKEWAGMQTRGPIASAKPVLGPSMVAGAFFGAAGTAGSSAYNKATGTDIHLGKARAEADALAVQAREAIIAANNSPKAVEAYKVAMNSGKSEVAAALDLEAVESRARTWAERTGGNANEWSGDSGKVIEMLERLEKRQTSPDPTLAPVESLDSVRDLLLSELPPEQRQALVEAYRQGDPASPTIDPAAFDADLKKILDDPAAVETIPEAARPAMESMRDGLVDLYKLADRRALSDGFDPALAESVHRTLEYRRANQPPPPPAFTMDADQAGRILLRYGEFKELSAAQQDAMIGEMARAAKFNFDGWDMPTDQKAMLGFIETEMKPLLDKLMHRGERSDKAQEGLASGKFGESKDIDLDRFGKFYTELTGDGNIAESASVKARELQLAERILLEQVTDLADTAANSFAPTDIAKWYAMMALHQQVHSTLRGVRSEAGHLLRSFNFIKKDPGTANLAAMNIVEGAGGMDAAVTKLNAFKKAETRAEQQSVLQDSLAAKTLDMFIEYRTMNLLTSPKTHVANISGNIGAVVSEALARLSAEKFVGDGYGIAHGEAWEYSTGIFDGVRLAIKLGKFHLQEQGGFWKGAGNIDQVFAGQEGVSILGKEGTKRSKLSRENSQEVFAHINKEWLGLSSEHNIITDGLSGMIEMLGRGLGYSGKLLFAEDQFFKIVSASAETRALVHRRALKESNGNQARFEALKEKYSKDVPLEIRKAAMEHAKLTTFQSDLGKWHQRVDKARRDFPPARLVAPFFKTPANIIKYVAAHTPVMAKLYGDIRADLKSPDLARRNLAEARIMNGTLLWTLGLSMAAAGTLTGRGPANKREREKLLATGWQPYSIKIGDSFIRTDRFDPIAVPLNMVASMYEIYQATDDRETLTKAFSSSFGAMYRVVSDKSYFQGFADLTGLLDGSGEGFPRLMKNLASSSVPFSGMTRMIRSERDPVFREVDSVMDSVMNTIPGLSELLPPRRDFIGREIKSDGYFGIPFISPLRQSFAKDDVISAESYRLTKVGQGIQGTPARYIREGEKALRLSGSQYSRLLELSGSGVRLNGKTGQEALEDLFKSSDYKSWDDAKKTKQARKLITDYRRAARKQLVEEDQQLRSFFGVRTAPKVKPKAPAKSKSKPK